MQPNYDIPAIKDISFTQLKEPYHITLKNGVKASVIEEGDQKVARLELVFQAGKINQSKPWQAESTSAMLREGSVGMDAATIAEKLDQLGASMSSKAGRLYTTIQVNCLSKRLREVLEILNTILLKPTFDPQEFKRSKARTIQRMTIDLEEVDYLATLRFSEMLYGENHPFGYWIKTQDIEAVQVEDLRQFHNDYILNGSLQVFVSGRFDENIEDLLNQHLSHEGWKASNPKLHLPKIAASKSQKSFYEKTGSSQCAIRIGKLGINRDHPDFVPFSLAKDILGGYFGSRLMSNIREEKGFTYGIYSAISNFHDFSKFYIASEVGSKVCTEALKETYLEIERLRSGDLALDELKLVKNYVLGSTLRQIDGPFRKMDVIKGLELSGKTAKDFVKNIHEVQSCSIDRVIEAAHRHLDPADLSEVVAGSLA